MLHECHDCGMMQRLPDVPAGAVAACVRCDAVLWRRHGGDPLGSALALTIAASFLFLVALAMPMFRIDLIGQDRLNTVFSTAARIGDTAEWPLGLLVLATIAVLPAIKLAAMLAVLLGVRCDRPPSWVGPVFGWMHRISRWAMIEVFLLGVFVAYSRLIAIATVVPGDALYALGAFTLVMAAADALVDRETVWRRLVPAPPPVGAPALAPSGLAPSGLAPSGLAPSGFAPPESVASARAPIGCERCRLASRLAEGSPCPRCGAALRRRRPHSLQTTWAFVIAAAILYVPANVYPVMTVSYLGRGAPNTILSGAYELLRAGLWPLALLVFFASITVPVLKLGGLVLMLVTTQRRVAARLRDRTRLYRIVEAVGRWSMIDVFMIAILVALVQAGALASIEPGGGAAAFAAVVILTMFASTAFDPRLMWDAGTR
jgi:paraquat-inducible protein A